MCVLLNKLYGDVKVFIQGEVKLKTALHIGTGRGDYHTDSTVMKDNRDRPFIPGSSMKGIIRSTAESLCQVVLGEEPCFLDKDSSKDCITAKNELLKEYNNILESNRGQRNKKADDFLKCNTCLPCKLFGSPVVASKISIADLHIPDSDDTPETPVRDGVGIDRDTETAREGVKFDFETVVPGASFVFEAVVDKPSKQETQLLAIALRELELGNTYLGGNTSRGLGRFKLEIEHIRYLSYEKGAMLDYLLNFDPEAEDPVGHLPEITDIDGALDQLISGHCGTKED
jgi:CRISPR-associated RAMP protein (TIGR02581 family)